MKTKKVIDYIHILFGFFDVAGGTIMGIWSFVMIGLAIYSVVAHKTIDGSVATVYGIAVSAFAGTNMHRNWLNTPDSPATITGAPSAKEEESDDTTDVH